MPKKSLAETHPEVAKQWHPTKNGNLNLNDFTIGSGKVVFWKCDIAEEHEWSATIISRFKKKGHRCPFCSGRKVCKSNSIGILYPKIAKQFHPTKNGKITAYEIRPKHNKKIWWKCDKGDDHVWESKPDTRIRQGTNCPICSGQKIVLSNCLATTHPEIAKQWHPTLNGDSTPFDFIRGSSKKVFWKCDIAEDHEWSATITSRFKKKGHRCPFCSGRKVCKSNSIGILYPKIAKQFHPTKNGKITAYEIRPKHNKKIWWKCDKGDDHVWESKPDTRIRQGTNCPICSGQKIVLSNCLATTHPEIAKQWHPTLNGDSTPFDFIRGSSKKVFWKCSKGVDHIWKTSINHIVNGTGCPVCEGLKVVKSNCLANTNPKLASEWHPTKNGNLTPYDVVEQTNKKIWWKCNKGDDHVWKTQASARVNQNQNCPVCANRKVVKSNCLANTNPKLASEWHPTKNGNLTPYDVVAGTIKKIWWKCNKGDDHVWKVSGNSRDNSNSDCPFCTLTPQSKQELTITFELMKLFKNIDPKGLKTRLEGRLRSIDIFIPKLNLCIEFDGSYWHKDNRELDKIKSEMLFEEGFKLIRVREEPLKKLYDTDVISKVPYNGKQVTNDVLSMIMEIYDLNDKLVSKIKEYQVKDELQNEKGLDRYIDKILTEKAEKKANK